MINTSLASKGRDDDATLSARTSLRYLIIAGDIIQKVAATQSSKIEQAAEISARSIVNDGLVFCWRGGHSHRLVEGMLPASALFLTI